MKIIDNLSLKKKTVPLLLEHPSVEEISVYVVHLQDRHVPNRWLYESRE